MWTSPNRSSRLVSAFALAACSAPVALWSSVSAAQGMDPSWNAAAAPQGVPAAAPAPAAPAQAPAAPATQSARDVGGGSAAADRPMTVQLPNPAPMPRRYGDTEAEGAGGRPNTMRSAKNALYVEGGGAGGIYSVNYDRMLVENVGFRIGVGYTDIVSGSFQASSVNIPVTVNGLWGSLLHKFELSAGPTIVLTPSGKQALEPFNGAPIGGSAYAGYRFQHPDGGLMLRVGALALFGAGQGGIPVWPWGAISIGYAF